MKKIRDAIIEKSFLIAALCSIFAVVLIVAFLFGNGLPAIFKIGLKEFLLGMQWLPSSNKFGILPMIYGSIIVTIGAVIVGVPIGILNAVFMVRYCPRKLYEPYKAVIELLAGIPSVVYGFFGIMIIVPFVRDYIGGSGRGFSILTASILLGIMILPTIVSVCEASLKALPQSYYEGALGLGSSKERAIFAIELPAAKSGILAGVILGLGRAIGETMAVIMVAGGQPWIPDSILAGVRTLTANIAMELGYAQDLHREALIATGCVLFFFVLIINLVLNRVNKGEK